VWFDDLAHLFKERFRRTGDTSAGFFNECSDLEMPGKGKSLSICKRPEFFDCFCRDFDLFGAGCKAGLAACTGKQAIPYRIRNTVTGVPGIKCKPHLLTHRGRPEEICYVHGRADRNTCKTFDAVSEGFYFINLCFGWQSGIVIGRRNERCDHFNFRDKIDNQVFFNGQVQGGNGNAVCRLPHTSKYWLAVYPNSAASTLPGPAAIPIRKRGIYIIVNCMKGMKNS